VLIGYRSDAGDDLVTVSRMELASGDVETVELDVEGRAFNACLGPDGTWILTSKDSDGDGVDERGLVHLGDDGAAVEMVADLGDNDVTACVVQDDGSVELLFDPESVEKRHAPDVSMPLYTVAPAEFMRSDWNENGVIDLSDAVDLLHYLFKGGPSPDCKKIGDYNDDGVLDLSDGINVLNYLFLGAAAPAAPFPTAGPDPDWYDQTLACPPSITSAE